MTAILTFYLVVFFLSAFGLGILMALLFGAAVTNFILREKD